VLFEDALAIQESQVSGLQCKPGGGVTLAVARALACGAQAFDKQWL
jgi:hypothetical protein